MRPAADGGPRRVPAGVDPAMSRSATVVRLSADLPRTVRRAAWGIACRLSRAAPDPGQAACPGEPRSNRRAPARPKPNGMRHGPSGRPPRLLPQRPRAGRRGGYAWRWIVPSGRSGAGGWASGTVASARVSLAPFPAAPLPGTDRLPGLRFGLVRRPPPMIREGDFAAGPVGPSQPHARGCREPERPPSGRDLASHKAFALRLRHAPNDNAMMRALRSFLRL